MSIRSLMSAAHAAGFALAVTEASDEDAVADMEVERREQPAISTSRALVLSLPEADRTTWMREWLQGFRARVTA